MTLIRSGGPAIQSAPASLLYQPSVAHRLMASGFNTNSLRVNTLLRKDEWLRVDEAVVDIARSRLVIVDAIRQAGLVRNLGSLGVLIDQYEKVGDMTDAEQDMTGVAAGEEDIPDFGIAGVPIPITHKDFRLNIRHLEASRTTGATIDTTASEIAARKVAEKLEDMVLNGSTIAMGTNTIPGLTNFSARVTGSVTANWGLGTTTGEQILTDTLAMISDLEAINFFGPFDLFVPTDAMGNMRDDFKANSDRTTLDRILDIDVINSVRAPGRLASGNVLLVQMTRDVLDLSVGSDIVTVEWEVQGGMQVRYKVLAAMAQRLKSNQDGTTGICHYS